jgi:hypothetical protein
MVFTFDLNQRYTKSAKGIHYLLSMISEVTYTEVSRYKTKN